MLVRAGSGLEADGWLELALLNRGWTQEPGAGSVQGLGQQARARPVLLQTGGLLVL